MEKVISHSDFLSKMAKSGKSFLLLYRSDSDQSICAYNNIRNVIAGRADKVFFAADVSTVRDIHTNYGISSVPALLVFSNSNLSNVIKGCQESSYYKALTENALYQAKSNTEGKPKKRVTVYSTPTCSWCNTLKTWLKSNNIAFSDIDISRDQRAAEDLVKRSGQQGVPQTDVNGQIVVGFNQPRLKELLEIN
jgi:glutaredoxin-like YruB-family protein